jgi:hypothetical protein
MDMRSLRGIVAVGLFAGIGVGTTAMHVISASAATPAAPTVALQPFAAGTATQTKPDDITALGGKLFVTFQNNAGPDGTPAGSTSTVVEFDRGGHELATWTLPGRCDGLAGDPFTNTVLASVNEDNNSSLFVITPGNPAPAHFSYSPDPSEMAPGETSSNGGTDSISIGTDGTVYVAHSNPDPGVGNTAATYTLSLSGTTANLTRLFGVQDSASVVGSNPPATTNLNLSDPDSNRFIPATAPVLPGALIQDSQADSQLVFVNHPHTAAQSLRVLNLTNAAGDPTVTPQLDDIEEVTGPGLLYVVDQKAGTISVVNTTLITPGTLFVSQPAPAAGDLANTPDLGVVDPATGVVTHLGTGLQSPKGLLFVPAAPTALHADPAIAEIGPGLALNLPNLIAHLADASGPVSGATIHFTTTTGAPICDGITDATGTARCAGSVSALLSLGFGYQATFTGNANDAPASGHGTLLTLLGLGIF